MKAKMNSLVAAATGTGAFFLFAGGAALAQTTESQLSQLQARIEALEAERTSQTATLGSVTVSPGIRLAFYGLVKADAVADSRYELGASTVGMAGVNAGTPRGSDQRIHAYQSRFGMRGEHDTSAGTLKFNIEGDFFGGGGGTLRLRQAFGQLGGWTVGQTWSAYVPLQESPDLADFNGTAGPGNFRVPLIRYSHTFGTGTKAEISFEEDYVSWGTNLSVVGALRQEFGQGAARIAYINRELNDGLGGETDAWGVNVAASYKYTPTGSILFSYSRGEGIASISGFSSAAGHKAGGAQTFFDVGADGKAVGFDGVYLAATNNWTDKFRTIFAVGQQSYDDFAGARDTDTDKLQTAHFQARYSLSDRASVGAELIHLKRRQFDGEGFSNNRLQLFAQLSF